MRGERIEGRVKGGEKGEKEGGVRLEREDFPGKFRETPDRQIRQGPPSPKTRDRHPFGGDHLPPPSPLLTPICVELGLFIIKVLVLDKMY